MKHLVNIWVVLVALTAAAIAQQAPATRPAASRPADPGRGSIGGEADSIVQIANLVYAGPRSRRCFSDHFVWAEKESAISTSAASTRSSSARTTCSTSPW